MAVDFAIPVLFARGKCIPDKHERLVYWLLYSWASDEWSGSARGISRKYISKITGYHVDRISKYISSLKQRGLVVPKKVRGGTNDYYVPHTETSNKRKGYYEPKDLVRFVLIPRKVLLNSNLSPASKILYVTLKALGYTAEGITNTEAGTVFLGRELGVSRRSISRYMRQLCGCGLLKVTRRKMKRNHYATFVHYNSCGRKDFSFGGVGDLGGVSVGLGDSGGRGHKDLHQNLSKSKSDPYAAERWKSKLLNIDY